MFDLTIAKELCKEFEGFRSAPYLCPAGVPTIGYGATYYTGGRKVALADPPISEREAEALLEEELNKTYLPGVLRCCPIVLCFPEVLNALVDFSFNLGVGRLQSSTLRRKVNEEKWPEAIHQIKRWVRGGGRVLPGLVRRREAEAALFPLI